MCLDLDNKPAGQRENSLESRRRLQRWQGEEVVCKAVAPNEHPVHETTIETIEQAFLTRLKREVTPNHCPRGQQPSEEQIGTEMHVMVSIKPTRHCSVETRKLVKLCGNDVLERISKPGVKYNLTETVKSQIRGESPLVLDEPSRSAQS